MATLGGGRKEKSTSPPEVLAMSKAKAKTSKPVAILRVRPLLKCDGEDAAPALEVRLSSGT